MGIALNDSSFDPSCRAGIESQYLEYQLRCAALQLGTHVRVKEGNEGSEGSEDPAEIFSLMLQTAKIDAPYQDLSSGEVKSFMRSRIKTFLRWLMRPFVKIALVHQQELNHLVVLLAQSHRVLEKKVAQLEAAAKSSETHR